MAMPTLEIRRIGNTNLEVKALGLGCAHLGQRNRVSDKEAIAAVRRAIELGIDFVDTSPLYDHSERRVGLALEGGYREKVILQTKAGTHPEKPYVYTADAIRWSVENSLSLLKTDYLDSVLIHDPPDIEEPLKPGAGLDELYKMKEEGLIGHIGLGVRVHEYLVRAMETGRMDIIITFLDYTLLDQSALETVIPTAQKHGVGVILASSLAMGLLAGPKPDRAHVRKICPGKEDLVENMWHWCRDRGVPIQNLAIRFCLAAPTRGVVLAGPADQTEVDALFEAATADIDEETWAAFHEEFNLPRSG